MKALVTIQNITLDLHTQSYYSTMIYAKQGDADTRQIRATLTENGQPYTIPDGVTASFRCLKPDGTCCDSPAVINEDKTVTVTFTQQMLAVPGAVSADISLEDEQGDVLSTASFVIRVEAVPFGIEVESINEFLELRAIVAKNRELTGEYETALEQLLAIQSASVNAANTAAAASQNASASETAASGSAQAAAVSEQNAANAADQAKIHADSIDPAQIDAKIELKADNLYFDPETKLLYLMSGGEIIGDGVEVAVGGGSGGGGGLTYAITLQNLLESRIITVAAGTSIALKFSYSSVDTDGMDDGDGVGNVLVGGVKRSTFAVKQGDNEVDITQYLSSGSNSVKVRVENSEGAAKTLSYTITVIALSLTTSFDKLASYSGDQIFTYTPVGTGTKLVHFVMDGKEIGTAEVTANGRSQSFTIPGQAYGGHLFTVYAEVEVDGVAVKSNTLPLGMIWTDNAGALPAITSTVSAIKATQGETLTIPYMVYDPLAEQASVILEVLDDAGKVYSTQPVTVGRSAQDWILDDYPAGTVKYRISCGETVLEIPGEITEYVFPLSVATDSLALEFNAVGRSNGEENPAAWNHGDTVASFSGFGWYGSDGWLNDADGEPILRFLPGDAMEIPFRAFEKDARETGYTIEVELATHNVRDYETVIISCLSGGRGFQIASQHTSLHSEQTTVSMTFKEDSRVRVTYIVEQRNQNRLVYIFVNGVMCGVEQYPTTDDFSQANPVGVSIGAETCGLDLYRIRFYTRALSRREQLDNYICDRPTFAARNDAYKRNNILDGSEEVSIEMLPKNLPYMILACAQLPQYKGDKKEGCTVTFVDPADSSKSFVAENVQLDVQGTSSQGYPVKNEKLKANAGFRVNGESVEGYKLSAQSIPVNVFCLKADYASSENANNVLLVDIYEDNCPYVTPPQETDPLVRQGIEGRPIVVFWQNTTTGEISFVGKFNFNNDKSTPEVFGFTSAYPNAQSWEFLNNTSNRVLFKESNYDSGWEKDFEARHPEGCTDYTQLKRVTDWVAAHNRDKVSTQAEKDALLADFKADFENYFVKDAMLYYYLFTELFLMVDNRAKNMFLTTYDGTHWLCIPYDMDTALGINNEGALTFTYSLEDTDTINGELVYNGQESVLWCNIRDAYADELTEMYQTLRSTDTFNYETVIQRFRDHQSVWPEALWNEDAFTKYLQPFLLKGEDYLDMLQGDKESQRDWWLFNAFRYRDSKYHTGDAKSTFIYLRCYELGDITVTPYADIYPAIKYGSYLIQAPERVNRNTAYTVENPNDTVNDTETYIYSADRLASVGDLSGMQVGDADFSAATKLQELILGSAAEGYTNANLTSLTVGNNELLTTLDIQNCTALAKSIDLSGCAGLEEVRAKGSAITGLVLPEGGHLRNLELPATVTNITIINQRYFEGGDIEGVDALTTLRIENTPNIPVEIAINYAPNLNRVRLIGVEWEATSEATLAATITKLRACKGLDAANVNTDKAVVQGKVTVPSISDALMLEIFEHFPELSVIAGGEALYQVRYFNYDGSLLYRDVVSQGDSAIDPVAQGLIQAPTRPGTDTTGYLYNGWDKLPTNITGNVNVLARYANSYAVFFYADETLLHTQWVMEGEDAYDPVAAGELDAPIREGADGVGYVFTNWDSLPENVRGSCAVNAQFAEAYAVSFYSEGVLIHTQWVQGGTVCPDPVAQGYIDAPAKEPTVDTVYTYDGWDTEMGVITAPVSVNAVFAESVRTYTVRFWNGDTLLQTVGEVPYGGTAVYTGEEPVGSSEDYAFDKFEPDGSSITGDTDCYAQYVFAGSYSKVLLDGTIFGTYVNADVISIGNGAFARCINLETIDFAAATSIGEYAFFYSSKLSAVILRSGTMCALANTNAFTGTPIENGTGYIYVPSLLVDSYKADAVWATYVAQIRAIEDYPDICGGE